VGFLRAGGTLSFFARSVCATPLNPMSFASLGTLNEPALAC
jgi:hypothetical protein